MPDHVTGREWVLWGRPVRQSDVIRAPRSWRLFDIRLPRYRLRFSTHCGLFVNGKAADWFKIRDRVVYVGAAAWSDGEGGCRTFIIGPFAVSLLWLDRIKLRSRHA